MRISRDVEKETVFDRILLGCVYLGAIISLCVGIVAIAGWHTHTLIFVQLGPSYAAIQYNTAICFVFIGLACLLLALNRLYWLLRISSLFVFLVATVTLLEYAVNWDAGIDNLIFRSYIRYKESIPGRMAVNAAISFMLCGISFFLLSYKKPTNSYSLVTSLLGSAIGANAVIVLLGFVGSIPLNYGWGYLNPMAPQTTIAFVFLGIAIVCASWSSEEVKKIGVPLWIIPAVGTFGMIVVLSTCQTILMAEHLQLIKSLKVQSEHIVHLINYDYRERIEAIERMAHRMNSPGWNLSDWSRDASNYLKKYEGYLWLAIVDGNKLIGVVPDLEHNRQEAEMFLSDVKVQQILKTNSILIPKFDYERKLALLVVPTLDPRDIIILADLPQLFYHMLHDYTSPDYATAITSDSVFLYRSNGIQNPFSEDFGVSLPINSYGLNLKVLVWTNVIYGVTTRYSLLLQILTLEGIFMMLLPVILVYFAQQSKLRALQAEAIASKLELEIKERRNIENLLRDSETRNQAILDTAVDGLLMIDENIIIHSMNPASERMFEVTKREMLGKELTLLLHPDSQSQFLEFFKQYSPQEDTSQGRRINMLEGITKSHKRFPVDLALNEVYLGSKKFYTVLVRDISEQVAFEYQLKGAKELADSANKAKSEFLANISHEIRTPMNAILGMSELLEGTPLNEEQKKYLHIFKSAGEQLLGLINDLLDISRIETGNVTFHLIDYNLYDIIEKTIAALSIGALKKKLQFTYAIDEVVPKVIKGDALRLRQILMNLLSNAIKFTEHGSVTLRVGIEKKEDQEYIKFEIKDTGIGIPEDKRAILFERFSQIDSSVTRKFGGTGLGLVISKELVELMGGTLDFESQVGIGSTFSFVLPLLRTKSPVLVEPKEKEPVRIKKDKIRTLIVEDSEDNLLLLQFYLKGVNCQIDTAENGEIALQKFCCNEYDLVLMDIQMPVMDGYSATAKIREWEIANNKVPVPIVALTAYASKVDEQNALGAGCNGYLTKPIKKQTLLDAIVKYTEELSS